jgi:hypothetical protein
MLLIEGEEYYTHQYTTEEELEQLVEKNAKKIFGENSIYLNIKPRIKSQAGIGSIPDGYVFTTTKPYKWHIIETELSNHPIYEHIVSQLNKFIIGIKPLESKKKLVKTFYETIKTNITHEKWLKNRIGEDEIYKFFTELIDESPTIIVVIDKKTPDLEEALSEISLSKKIIEFETYRSKNGEKQVHRFEPLHYSTPSTITAKPSKNNKNIQKKSQFYEEQFFKYTQKTPPEQVEIIKDLYKFSQETCDKISWGYSSQKGISSFSPYYLEEEKIIEPFTLYPDGKIKIYIDYAKRTLSQEKYTEFINNLTQTHEQIEKSQDKKTPTFTIKELFIGDKNKLEKFKQTILALKKHL